MAGEQRFYSEEEAQQILHRATTSVPATGMSREELVRAAGEMGISADAIERAESEIAAQRQAELSAQEEARLRREFNRYYRRKTLEHLSGFGSFAGVFVFIWLFSGGGYFWPIWVFGWWGVALIGDVFSMLVNPARKERSYEKWLAKREGKTTTDEPEEDEDSFRTRRRRRWREYRW